MTAVYTMLVLTEDTLTDHDVRRLSELHAPEPVAAVVVVPSGTDQTVLDQVVDDIARVDVDELAEDVEGDQPTAPEELRVARRHLAASVKLLTQAGISTRGELVPDHPVDSVARLASQHDVDEVIVITEPHLVTDALRRDWATQVRHRLKAAHHERPVLHFIAGTDRVVS
jgi:hypothetical protein